MIFYTSKETIQELQRVMFKMNFTLFLIDRVFLVKTCIFKILYLKWITKETIIIDLYPIIKSFDTM